MFHTPTATGPISDPGFVGQADKLIKDGAWEASRQQLRLTMGETRKSMTRLTLVRSLTLPHPKTRAFPLSMPYTGNQWMHASV